jgi:hypothetical protein
MSTDMAKTAASSASLTSPAVTRKKDKKSKTAAPVQPSTKPKIPKKPTKPLASEPTAAKTKKTVELTGMTAHIAKQLDENSIHADEHINITGIGNFSTTTPSLTDILGDMTAQAEALKASKQKPAKTLPKMSQYNSSDDESASMDDDSSDSSSASDSDRELQDLGSPKADPKTVKELKLTVQDVQEQLELLKKLQRNRDSKERFKKAQRPQRMQWDILRNQRESQKLESLLFVLVRTLGHDGIPREALELFELFQRNLLFYDANKDVQAAQDALLTDVASSKALTKIGQEKPCYVGFKQGYP